MWDWMNEKKKKKTKPNRNKSMKSELMVDDDDDDNDLGGVSHLKQDVMNYGKIMKAVRKRNVVPKTQTVFWGSHNSVNLERKWRHMEKKKSTELIVGVIILSYNSTKCPFIRPSNGKELSVL